MIPFIYKLRDEVHIVNQADSYLVVSDLPLNAVRMSGAAVRILESCDGMRTLAGIAQRAGSAKEEEIFKVCEYFRERGFLEQEPAPSGGLQPSVSVIIPVKNRCEELVECLESVFAQDYPHDRMEVIVIDDGSTDETFDAANRFPVKLFTNPVSRGQSFCRNLGAREACGEILAFLDSDCVAEPTWLRELTAYFSWERVGAVGGYVDGYFGASVLDRYEQAASPLNMGKRHQVGNHDSSTLYVPTCNLLVRKIIFLEAGGFQPELHVGEDVDFCWRMRNRGHLLVYAPRGAVRHKHRNSLRGMLSRRCDYGTSEALLYRLHSDKKKRFNVPPLAGLSCLTAVAGILSLSAWVLLLSLIPLLLDIAKKELKLRQARLGPPIARVAFSVIRGHCSMGYFFSFHLIRYYLVLLIPLGLLVPSAWLLSLVALLLASAVDYTTRRPRLPYPIYVMYYTLEHLAYQLGVAIGCLRSRKFGSYIPVLTIRRPNRPLLGEPPQGA